MQHKIFGCALGLLLAGQLPVIGQQSSTSTPKAEVAKKKGRIVSSPEDFKRTLEETSFVAKDDGTPCWLMVVLASDREDLNRSIREWGNAVEKDPAFQKEITGTGRKLVFRYVEIPHELAKSIKEVESVPTLLAGRADGSKVVKLKPIADTAVFLRTLNEQLGLAHK